jgi:hypothetical protein
VGLLLLLLVCGELQAGAPATLPALPQTDGIGLPPAPPPLGLLEWQRLIAEGRRVCEGPCVTPFGQVLGVADGVEAHSNYDNLPWQDPHAYARRIPLFEINGRFTLLDVPPDHRSSADGGRIGGWVYPLP